MGCRTRGSLQEEECPVTATLGDALLLTFMCIIGLPVDVHVKDGSIYSGTFHTACPDDNYAIVLKRARMAKQGSRDANVANGGIIETLVILSEDLVQVVAKRVLPPAEGFTGNVTGDHTQAVAGTFCSETKTEKSSKSNVDRRHMSQTRCSSRTENGSANGFTSQRMSDSSNVLEVENSNLDDRGSKMQKEEAYKTPVDGRQVGDDNPQGNQCKKEEKSDSQNAEIRIHEVQGSKPRLDACDTQSTGVACDGPAPSFLKRDHQCAERLTSAADLSVAISSGASTGVSFALSATKESYFSSSSTSTEMVPPRSSSSNRTAKEFKLNPGANIFSPSLPQQKTATPPATVPTVASMPYIPDNYPVAPLPSSQPEMEISPFAPRSSRPVKFLPYGNMLAGNGANDVQYSPPIVGHVTNRTQPIRYGAQYHPIQAGPTYIHPSSQNVMVGRLGQLVYVHPVSQDVVQGSAGFSQVSTCSLLTPHQIHLPKHQGPAAAQALQLCATPPFITPQSPIPMPGHIPISQPPFPLIRPIPVPGSNGFLGSKYS